MPQNISFGFTFIYTHNVFPLIRYEKDFLEKGYKYIAGIDEVGRGPLAGPMVVSAVILDIEKILELEKVLTSGTGEITNNDIEDYKKINDSKKLSAKKREELEVFIKRTAVTLSIVEISNKTIDEVGISEATQITFFQSIQELKIKPDMIITDNFPVRKILPEYQLNLTKGDANSISVAAASIVAKVYRDALMTAEHLKYPEYGFDSHKGYGTKDHIEALKKHGPCPIHRLSFEPVKSLVNK